MGKADRIKMSKSTRNESLEQQIGRTEYAQAKGRVKVCTKNPLIWIILSILNVTKALMNRYASKLYLVLFFFRIQLRGRKEGEEEFVNDKLSAEILKQARMQQKEIEEEHGILSVPTKVSIPSFEWTGWKL